MTIYQDIRIQLAITILLILPANIAFAQQTTCWSWESYSREPCYDSDYDEIPDDLDECPNEWAIDSTYDGCPYKTFEYTVEPQYFGPKWVLVIIDWHEEKRIDDKTLQNALEYLLEKNIIQVK